MTPRFPKPPLKPKKPRGHQHRPKKPTPVTREPTHHALWEQAVLANLAAINAKLATTHKLEKKMAKELDDLITEVAEANAGIDAAIVAIGGLRQQILDAGSDPAKLKELTDSLQSAEDRLAAAIVAPAPDEEPTDPNA